MFRMVSAHDEFSEAIVTFVRGYCVGRSATHPCECARVERMWVMRDAPRRNPRDYRKEEWVAYGVEPQAADATARRHARGRFVVSAMLSADESDQSLRMEYKRLGYRLLAREPLFVHRLKRIVRAPAPAAIRQVRTPKLAVELAKVLGRRPIPPACLGKDGPYRQYVAVEGDAIVGWVRSVPVGKSTWCSHMEVQPSHRRRGIGRAMLAKMLRDDRALGFQKSVLLSSKAGALLYPHAGYEQIGTLFIHAPSRK
jgi:GNAT superfamily N-acetyltransferase